MTRSSPERAAGPRGWHVPEDILRRYADAALDTAATWSVEAHLPGCAECRARAAALVDPDHLHRLWLQVEDTVDTPAPGPLERALARFGVPGHTARLLAATPALRTSWLGAVFAVLVIAVGTAYAAGGPGRSLPFLVLAPLLPLAGVAGAYGPAADPSYEIGVAAPLDGMRLLFIRVIAVLGTTLPITGLASLLLPDSGRWAAGWLLPALALALGGLALSSLLDPPVAVGAMAAGWAGVVLATIRPAAGAAGPFSAAGQAGSAALAVAACIAMLLCRRRFDSLTGSATGTAARHLPGFWKMP